MSSFPNLQTVVGVIKDNRYSTDTKSWQRDVDNQYGENKVKFFAAKAPVFIISEYPGKIFKMNKDFTVVSYQPSPCKCSKEKVYPFNSVQARFTNASLANEIVKQYSLTKMKCTHVELVKTNSDTVAVENMLEFDSDENKQAQLFNSNRTDLDETIKQFAKFILLTGYADVKAENNPLSEDLSVNLVDFEHCYKPCSETPTCTRQLLGIFGGGNVSTNKGLISLVSKRHAELVTQVCRDHFGNHWSQEWENRAQIKINSRS